MKSIISDIRKKVPDSNDQKQIIEKLDLFNGTSTRDVLSMVSSELFPYEKRYIVPFNAVTDILICTVGMRENPIILSILAVRPKTVILLHTEGSRKTVDSIVNDEDIIKLRTKFETVLIDEVDAAKNFDIFKKEVLPITENKRVRIDPTGGRKIMGTAVGAFAFFYRIPMIYLHAEEKMGISIPFSGNIRNIDNPYEYFGDVDMKLLKDNFDHGYFEAAIETCEKLIGTVRDIGLHSKLLIIKQLAEVYRDWNVFMHSRYYSKPKDREDSTYLAQRLEKIVFECDRFGLRLFEQEDVQKNISFLQGLESGWKCKSNIVDSFRLIDLFMNAGRRAEQGLFDDATARLYRCIEMCANMELEKEGISNLIKIDYEVFAQEHEMDKDSLMSKFHELSGFDEPQSPPGLNDQMFLLQVINNPVGKVYAFMTNSNESGDSIRDKRNRSILAHGTNPIRKEDYEPFERETQKMLISTLGYNDFRQLSEQAIFPKLLI